MNTNAKKLAGRVAVVTGASKGVGASIAKHLAAEGAAVVVNYASSKAGADKVVSEIKAQGGKAIAVKADVTQKPEIVRLFAETMQAFGQLDVLVNNAGVYEFRPLERVTEAHFHRQFDVNVLGLMLTTQAAVRQFGPSGGSIINISSVASTSAPAGGSVYSATKGAVDALTKSLAKELAARKIRVNAINPGLIETEGVHAVGHLGGDLQKQIESQTPLGRIGQPQDIATVATFLASEDSGWITGETFPVTGGYR
jgi:3-oxoacyl-[acyl-carrier protein] reductase